MKIVEHEVGNFGRSRTESDAKCLLGKNHVAELLFGLAICYFEFGKL